MIIHVLPNGWEVREEGWVKVHYDLCKLERELGWNSVIAFPDKNNTPKWFTRNEGSVLSWGEARQLSKKDKVNLVIGWEDPEILDREFPDDYIKVCYIQEFVFFRNSLSYKNKHLWFINKYTKDFVKEEEGFVLEPFVRPEIFYPLKSQKFEKYPYKILVQRRKGGKEASIKLKALLPIGEYSDRLELKVLEDTEEFDYARELGEADIFLSHSYPKGFNLSALEAMASKTLVIGFDGGGGREFMRHNENCFTTLDGNFRELSQLLKNVLDMSKKKLEVVLLEALKTSKKYSRKETKRKLSNILKTYNLY